METEHSSATVSVNRAQIWLCKELLVHIKVNFWW